MKSKVLVALSIVIAIIACNKEKLTESQGTPKSKVLPHYAQRFTGDSTDTGSSRFIAASVANQMINSYLYSINSAENDTDIKSFTVSADSLRALLENTSIHSVKLILAHTMSYINAGNNGVYAGYQSGALTIVVAAYDTSGNYVYYGGNVLDHLAPCPYSCPSGNAGADLLQ